MLSYIDESGGTEEGDVLIMAGPLIDAYRLYKHKHPAWAI